MVKNFFRSIVLINFSFFGAWLAGFSNCQRGCTFVLISAFHPPVETGGYSYLTLSESCLNNGLAVFILCFPSNQSGRCFKQRAGLRWFVHPPVETGGYSNSTPSELFSESYCLDSLSQYSILCTHYFFSNTRIIFLSKSRA